MQLMARNLTLDLSVPRVMGILNVTPDSFSDGGRYNNVDRALQHVQTMIASGADMIDIGGESTRPGAAPVSEQEEIDRVIPVIEALKKRFDIWLSVDTSRALVITEAVKAGVDLINDVRALQQPGALDAAISSGLPVCLVHMQGQPENMQQSPDYLDVIADITIFFQQNIDRCIAAGMKKNQLILDPGFGFGKNLFHNYKLLAYLNKFHHFDLPLLVGMSRKSMIGQLLHTLPEQRVTGSVACAVIAAMQGVKIIRAHDVKETVEAMRIVEATLSARINANYDWP